MSTPTLLLPDYYAPPSPPKPPTPTKYPKPYHHSSPRVGLIIGISTGVFFIFLIVVYIVCRSRHHHDDEEQHKAELPVLSSSAPVSAASSNSAAAAAASSSTDGTAVATASSTSATATSSSRPVTFPSSSSSQTPKVEENTQVIVEDRNPWMLPRDVRGMPEAEIDALGRGRYSANGQDVGRSSTPPDHVCGVCHYRFASNDDMIILHPCRHPVHIQCVLHTSHIVGFAPVVIPQFVPSNHSSIFARILAS